MDKLVSFFRGRTILYRSFVISLASLVVGAAIVGLTARAANYTALVPGAVNWTATNSTGGSAVWGCGTVAPTDSCGIYPGQLTANPFVDNATMNLGSPLSLAVTTSIPAPFTLTMNGFGMSVDVASGGTMSLTGNSAVTSTGGTNVMSVSGGTLSLGAGANLGINGLSSGAQFVFNGGSMTGSGNFTTSQQGFMSVTGAQGPMTSGNLLNITNNSTITYSATTNGWTLNGPLANTGTFNDNGSAAISGGGSINNTGVFQKSSGAPSTVGVPFNDSGTVSITSTSGPSSIDFSGGGNLSGPFNLGVLAGSSFLFAGTAATPTNFNAGASFSGNGNVTFHGSRQNVNTTLFLPGNLTNNGNTFFGSGTPQTINVAGTFTQAAAPVGSIDARLFNATSFDKVAVTGTAGLSGNMNESVLYSPANGDTIQPVTFSNNGGTTFQTVNAINPNGVFLVTYPPSTASATALRLAAVSQADIAVGKSGPGTLLNGQNGTWNLSVTNNGPSAAGPVVLTESFTNALFVSSTPALCTGPGSGPLTCTIPTLGIGATQPIAIVLKANGAGTITNTFSVSSTTPADPNSLNDTITTTTTVTAASDLSLSITGPPTASASTTISYTGSVGNGGPDPVTPTATFSVSAGSISAASGLGFTCTVTTPTASCTATGPMASGGSAPITLTVVTPASPGTLTVSGNVTPTASDPSLANNNASASTTVGPASADISVSKTLTTATPIAGQNVQYTVVVTNNGPSAATNVQLTDSPSANLTFVSNTGACSTGFPCTIGPMANGAVVSFTSTFALAPNAGGATFTNSVTATEPSDSSLGNNTGTASAVAGVSADVSIAKALTSTLTAGANATYSITVTNNGPSNAAGVVVNDATPAGMTFVSNTGACVTPFPCNLGTLAAGASAAITTTYAVAPTATGTISNTATVTATTPDPTPGNNTATATGTIGTNADLSITKTGPASASAGQTITYTINVVNNGPSTATGVVVNDPTPANTTAGAVSGPCTSFPCNIGTMAPASSTTISATYTINVGATGSVTNTATVSSTSTDPTPTNNTASKTTTITALADLQIVKSGPSGLPPGGGSIIFTIVVKNLGPGTATNLVVNDSPSAGLTFVSNSGACSTPFPCTIASLAAGAQATIQSTFSVPANLQRASNTADVNSSTTPDPNPSNNTSTVNLGSSCPNGSIVQFSPFSGQADAPVAGLVQWTAVSNATYDVYLGPAGSGCTTLLASNVNGTSVAYSGLTANTDYESRIVASRGSCPAISSQCIRWRTGTGAGACNLAAPVIIAPAPGANVGSTVTLKWNAVAGANNYHVVVMNGATTVVDTTTPNTSLDVTVPNGAITWSVTALSDQNCTSPAANSSFNVCAPPEAPLAGVVGAPTSGHAYSVIVVNPSPNNVRYEFQEADNASFSNATTLTSSSPTESYTHTTSSAQVLFYRVRAFVGCTNTAGPYSKTIRVVIVPPQVNRINVPAGSKDLVVVQVQVPGEATPVNFTATSSRPWVVKIDPSNGILPAVQGLLLNVTIDPAQLPNGTFTSSIIITTSPLTSSGRLTTNGGNKSVPVTINLVTPVVPNNPSGPTADSLIIPAVGHLAGINSQWRSDIRIYNASPQTLSYLLNFTAQGSSDVKQTTITTASGDTTALDDIIHNWFGVGEVGDSSTGVLEIRPMLTDGTTTPPKGTTFTTVASSRTFSETSQGTVGQFIPPVKFTNFIGTGAKLSLQQLSQSNSYRTNFGLVEASGSPVSLTLSMFSSAGSKLFDLPVNLAAGEQKQLNGLLATQGVNNLTDGRMEVVVAGGNGKVTAYASVIDNQSSDPQLVPGQTIGGSSSRLYVVPGVADLNNGVAAWRTDMRVYNSGNAPQTANLTFFAQGNSTSPSFATFSVNPGEVKVLDNVLQSTFSTHDVGGMVQVTTPSDSQLVVTARTFNQTSNGTLGQFIKAATTADGITTNTRGLNILEVEDSPRFRTNLGLAEMSGRAATVEVSVILPDSKLTPTIQVPLAANEFRQFSVEQFGLGDIYNARVSVKVVDGQGSVTAYGSVIDQITTDPTYVQAQ